MPRVKPDLTRQLSSAWTADIGDYVTSLRWSPDGGILAAASASGEIWLIAASQGEVIQRWSAHQFGTAKLDWHPDGKLLASAGHDGFVRIWEAASGRELARMRAASAWAEHLAWSPRGTALAAAAGKILTCWDPAGNLIQRFPEARSTLSDLAWKPASEVVAASEYGGTTLWATGSEEPLLHLGWKSSVLAMAWSPDGRYLATGDQDASVHFWILDSESHMQMSGYPTKVKELSWDSESRYLATGGGMEVCVWDCSGEGPEGTTPILLEAHQDAVLALAYQQDGPMLASGGQDGKLFLWMPHESLRPQAVAELEGAVTQVTWSRNDRRLAVGTAEGTVAVFLQGSANVAIG